MPKLRVFGLSLLGAFLSAHPAGADVRLPAILSSHMVLQRQMALPIWGWADPGESVTVSLAGQSKTATAGADGKWSVKLDPIEARDPLTLTVQGKNTLTLEDVLVGEVWVGSGQSNMQLPVIRTNNGPAEKAAAQFPQIRLFSVARKTAETPQADCVGQWVVCSPATIPDFSAAAYYFGRELHQKLQVPVGLINASWGGTPIEAWTSQSAQEGKAELEPIFAPWKPTPNAADEQAKVEATFAEKMAAWKLLADQAKADGKRPPTPPKAPISRRLDPNHPANLFNGLIAPLIPYAIRGAIWYQGESNTKGDFARLYSTQLPLMISDWRQRWKQGDFHFAWVQLPNFGKPTEDPAAPSSWAVLREGMLQSLSVPNTGMSVNIDIGEANDIHPKDKQTVGQRLSLWALAKVYGQKLAYSGPLPAGQKITGAEVRLSFTHTEGCLVAKGGELRGFAVAGADQKWVWAKARIEGEQVIVSSPEVPAPVAVRYAWADNPTCNLFNRAGLPATPFRTDTW